MGIIAKDCAIEPTPTTSTLPTCKSFIFTEGAVTWGGSSVNVVEAVVSLNNNLEADRRFIGSRYISEPIRAGGKLAVNFSMTVEFDSTAQYVDFRAATSRVLTLVYTGDIISAGYRYSLTATIQLGRLLHALPLINDEGRLTYEISGRAFRSTTYKELQLTLVNTTATIA